MPENLMFLTIRALDEFNHIQELQEILEICLEQLDGPIDKQPLRTGLLVTLYQFAMSYHLDELKTALEGLRRALIANSQPSSS